MLLLGQIKQLAPSSADYKSILSLSIIWGTEITVQRTDSDMPKGLLVPYVTYYVSLNS